MPDINPKQITFARVRRRYTKAQLAKELGVTSRTVQNYEAGTPSPDSETLAKIAKLLNFPQQFFFIDEDMPELQEHAVSFRALSKMSDAMRKCAFSVASIAFKMNDWMEERFNLPQANLPDLSDLEPEEAANTLRRMWGLGNAPIPNMIHLLESKGIRVFALTEEVRDADAFCTWHDGKPFVFLNTLKSAERSRFDAAHELAHLVRDVYSMQHGEARGPEIEHQANAFASAFLMPKASVLDNQPPTYTTNYLMKLKRYWGVSLVATAYRFHSLDLISEWNYRTLCIEMAKKGYRTNEPEGMEREKSQLLTKVQDYLQTLKQGWKDIAHSLSVSVNEINALTFQLTPLSVVNGDAAVPRLKQPPKLRLVS